ncbi:MAG: oxygen-independent coproporphyrinogen III oxidase, partial [Leptospiraceae bacterium]|nr:oxygen-independent coproporphyrinogen III oxidase [Leptospiraceae bacterium]
QRVPATGERALRELHLGGGSPTYLSPDSMQRLLEPMLESCRVSADVELSIEVDPRRTTFDQLKVLAGLGFRRISLGVQDFDPEVQRLINRNQDYECTRRVTEQARELGYHSINYDLIYGLPRQDERTMRDTIEKTIALRPDRLAFYSYARVPWIKAAQRLFTEADLPSGEEKRNLYEVGRQMFASADYQEIGMDHFALRTDGLWKAVEAGTLHRNFMGYTTQNTNLMLGLGVSSISDSWDCFHQNEKVTKKYQKMIGEGQLPTFRGHMLSPEDLRVRRLILDVATTWRVKLPADLSADVRAYLSEMEADNLIVFEGDQMRVTDVGRPFLRNICMGLDLRFRRNKPDTKVFSQSI